MSYTSTDYGMGEDFGVYVNDTLIACAVDNSFNLTRAMINVSNKQSGSDEEVRPGRGSGTVSGSSKFKYNAGYGWPELLALYKNKTEVTIRYSNNVTGDDEDSFKAYLSSVSRTDPDNENSTIEYEFTKTGSITTQAVSA